MHREALTQEGIKIFGCLHPAGFALGGGTGLALQLGHRISEDLDFFDKNEIAPAFLGILEKELAGLNLPQKISVNNKDELTVIAGETKITFLHYPFPTILPFVYLDGLAIFSAREIAAMKAYALGRRGTLKDYADLYFVLRNGETLKSIADLADKKFGDAFDTRLFLEQLVYLKDVEELPIRFLAEPVTKEELQKFFENLIKKFQV